MEAAEYIETAERGDAEAQYNLGVCYEKGYGVKEDYSIAIEWYKKAAEQGNPQAQVKLGDCYKYGHGVKLNKVQAIEWYLKAAEQGHDDGLWAYLLTQQENIAFEWLNEQAKIEDPKDPKYQFIVGICYAIGFGVKKELHKFVKIFRKLALNAKEGILQLILGVCYENGYGVTQDYTKAVEWFSKAAEHDNVSALYKLGECFKYGNGVEKDYNNAIECYAKAIERKKDYISELFFLAVIYYIGQDYDKVFQCIKKLAETDEDSYDEFIYYILLAACYKIGFGTPQNYHQAISCLRKTKGCEVFIGICYAEGYGVKQDYCQAVEWFKTAAENDDCVAPYYLGICYYYGYGVKQDYCQAVEFFKESAENNNSEAINYLGCCYYYGRGVQQDHYQAAKCFQKSAEQPMPEQQLEIKLFLDINMDMIRNTKKTIKYVFDSLKRGNAIAQFNLGNCYYNGYGVAQDYSTAFELYRKAAEQGISDAQNSLGYCYENGYGTIQNYDQATEWYRKAAGQGDIYGQYNLGYCYANGHGVERNTNQAALCYRSAAIHDDNDAEEELEKLKELNRLETKRVYITYARNDESTPGWEHIADVVNIIVKILRENKIDFWIDEKDAENGETITDFEQKIGESKYTILIFSDKYFQSLHCMYEFTEIKKGLERGQKEQILYIKSGDIEFNTDYIKKIQRKWKHNKADIECDLADLNGDKNCLKEIQRKALENDYYQEDIKGLMNYFSNKNYWSANKLNDDKYDKLLVKTIKSWYK